jgi:cytochrome o ubiquinol oxidase subunit 2
VSKTDSRRKPIFVIVATVWFLGIVAWYLHGKNFAVLNPAGEVAGKERNLLLLTVALGMLVIIPVYIMLFTFAWRYREGGHAKYTPDKAGSRWLETVWWGVPSAIILLLSVITWNSSHALDPHKALASPKPPLTIQVVALDWKWLFIYPAQNVASVNWVQLPVDTPVTFDITSDAPMNSFWIPQLGGQIYAMPGMSTQLHLIAGKPGDYEGLSANISGRGFAGMRFMARAGSDREFAGWLAAAKSSPSALDATTYNSVRQPSENNPVTTYSSVRKNLYDNIVLKYLSPGGQYAR